MNIVIVSVVALVVNILLGMIRARYKKMTIRWWLMIHASIPLIIPLRIMLDTPTVFIPLFIVLAFIGQMIGTRYIMKKKNRS